MEKLTIWLQSERGRRKLLAARLGVTPGAINHWGTVPLDRALAIEEVTGIPRHELCPEMFDAYIPISAIADVSRKTLETSNA